MYLDAFNDFPSKAEDWKSLRKIISKALEVSLPDKPVDYNADENHIRNGSKGHNHNWNKFNLDPNDPNSYPFILGIIKKTVENYDNISREIHNGRDTVFYFTKYFCDYDATVTVKLIELMESLRLSNAYVN